MMVLKKFCILFLILLPVVSGTIIAQDKEFGLWTGFEIEKDLGDKIELQVGLENRLMDNLNQRDETFVDASISYRTGIIAAGFGYRITNNDEEGEKNWGYSHRLIGQFRLRPEWERFSFDFRTRYQKQYFNVRSSEDGHIPENYFRNRAQVSYNIRKSDFEPAVSYELYYFLNQLGNNYFDRTRLSLDLEYEINKDNSVELSYIIQHNINQPDPLIEYIISLEYKLDL